MIPQPEADQCILETEPEIFLKVIVVTLLSELPVIEHANKIVNVLLTVDIHDDLRDAVSAVRVTLDAVLALNNLENRLGTGADTAEFLPGEEQRVRNPAKRVKVDQQDMVGSSSVHIKHKVWVGELALDVVEEEVLDVVQNVDTIRGYGGEELTVVSLRHRYQVVTPDETPELPGRGYTLKPPYRKYKTPGRCLTYTIATLHEGLVQIVLDKLATLQQENNVERCSAAE